MTVIWQWIAHLYAILAVVPFLPFVIIFIVLGVLLPDRKKAFGYAADVTTFLLVGSVSALYDKVVHTSLNGIWLLVLAFVIGAGLLGSLQNRNVGMIDYKKIFRAVWRFGFLFLSFCYLLLSVVSIIQHIAAV
ncbi:MAG TPA: DUF3397 domain-containing protein [Bacilli bacterium]